MLWTSLPDSPNGLIFLLFFLIFRLFQCSIFSEIFDFFGPFPILLRFFDFFICSVLINECPFLASQFHLNSHQTHLLSLCLFLLRLYNSSSFSPYFPLLILFSFSLLFPLLFFSTLDSPANLLPKSFPLQVVLHTILSLRWPIQATRIFAKFLRLSFEDQPNLGAVNWRGEVIYVLTVRRIILSEWKIGRICQFFFFYFFRATYISGACPIEERPQCHCVNPINRS